MWLTRVYFSLWCVKHRLPVMSRHFGYLANCSFHPPPSTFTLFAFIRKHFWGCLKLHFNTVAAFKMIHTRLLVFHSVWNKRVLQIGTLVDCQLMLLILLFCRVRLLYFLSLLHLDWLAILAARFNYFRVCHRLIRIRWSLVREKLGNPHSLLIDIHYTRLLSLLQRDQSFFFNLIRVFEHRDMQRT